MPGITKIKLPLPIIAALLVVIVIVLIIVFYIGKEKIPQPEGRAIPEEIYRLAGTITAIEESGFILNALIYFTDGTYKREARKILVDENTIIVKLEFPKVAPEDRDKPVIPKETKLAFSDLEIGNNVSVSTQNPETNIQENIRDKGEFLAKTIDVIFSAQ